MLYIGNHLSYKPRNDLCIYKFADLESTFIESGEIKEKIVLRIYEVLMSGQAVRIRILILLMFWNMPLNNYTQCLAQPPRKAFLLLLYIK